MSDRDERVSRRSLLERTGVAAGALALGATTLVGGATGAEVEHGSGGIALAAGDLEDGTMFKLTGFQEAVELDGACHVDEPSGVPYERYDIDYCGDDGDADAVLYVPPGRVQPRMDADVYVLQSVTSCDASDRSVVSYAPVANVGSCLPGWK